MKPDLLVMTTAGKTKFLIEALDSLKNKYERRIYGLDVLVVDDATPNIKRLLLGKDIKLITKDRPKGLTDSWNRAFQYFRDENYERCILSNDDVKFPKGFWIRLFGGLEEFDIVGPLSNQPGHQPKQKLPESLMVKASLDNIDEIQQELIKAYSDEPFEELPYFNGFCFAFSRSLEKFMFSDKLVFDPKNINIGNEEDLSKRVLETGGKIAVCKTSYIFHWKGRSVVTSPLVKDREKLWRS